MITVKNRNYTAYEQDIRELLQAFFPGQDLTGEESGEALFVLSIDELMREEKLSGVRFEDKSAIKGKLYQFLSEKTGRELPWGTLTGIKPVKLAEKILRKTESEAIRNPRTEEVTAGLTDRYVLEKTDRELEEQYRISEKKRALMLEIALKERELLKALPKDGGYSFYIGIPFCPSRCLYCSFTSNPISRFENRVGEYLQDLKQELGDFDALTRAWQTEAPFYGQSLQHESTWRLEEQKRPQRKTAPSTVYVGGGTPTALSASQLETLLYSIEEYTDTGNLLEFTVEAGRPDSITREKLEVLRAHGVNRISVNPQTMNQKTLDLIGRQHTVQQCLDAFRLARELGFDNINMDVIMGLPGEKIEDVRHTLEVIEELQPESLTVHSLAVKRAARLSTEHDPWKEYERAEGNDVLEMTELGAECARRLGMEPYYLYRQKNIAGNQENTGYALPGKESLYNIIMMEEKQPVIGFGAGSTTKLSGTVRMENVKDLTRYLDRNRELILKKRVFLSENREFWSPELTKQCN